MKVYQVTMPYYDGGHDRGLWSSPIFLRKEDAVRFASIVLTLDHEDARRWWTDDMYGKAEELIAINEIEVVDKWDGVISSAKAILTLFWNSWLL